MTPDERVRALWDGVGAIWCRQPTPGDVADAIRAAVEEAVAEERAMRERAESNAISLALQIGAEDELVKALAVERIAKEAALAALAAMPHEPRCASLAYSDDDPMISEYHPEWCICWRSRAPGREEAAFIRAALAYSSRPHAGSGDPAWAQKGWDLLDTQDRVAAALVATGRWNVSI